MFLDRVVGNAPAWASGLGTPGSSLCFGSELLEHPCGFGPGNCKRPFVGRAGSELLVIPVFLDRVVGNVPSWGERVHSAFMHGCGLKPPTTYLKAPPSV